MSNTFDESDMDVIDTDVQPEENLTTSKDGDPNIVVSVQESSGNSTGLEPGRASRPKRKAALANSAVKRICADLSAAKTTTPGFSTDHVPGKTFKGKSRSSRTHKAARSVLNDGSIHDTPATAFPSTSTPTSNMEDLIQEAYDRGRREATVNNINSNDSSATDMIGRCLPSNSNCSAVEFVNNLVSDTPYVHDTENLAFMSSPVPLQDMVPKNLK
ncbi:hypothetical protein SNE40_010863 [Patella caerulea]|uniref:Uncharacterized protein n=1 Tax=Patella caerulea TaxID=87958 RepID=A0AAN8K2U8_PATCE